MISISTARCFFFPGRRADRPARSAAFWPFATIPTTGRARTRQSIILSTSLKRDVAKAGAEKIDLIAHSMGNKPMLEALDKLESDSASGKLVKIGEMVMAAPDVEIKHFKQLIKSAHRFRRAA